MNEDDVERIAAWLVERGLAGASETELLHGLCKRCCQGGLPLSRAMALVDTLHPVYEGRVFRWRNDGVEESAVLEYGPTDGAGARCGTAHGRGGARAGPEPFECGLVCGFDRWCCTATLATARLSGLSWAEGLPMSILAHIHGMTARALEA
jgi:hypothetical protein